MRARIMGKVVDLDEHRVKGGVEGNAAGGAGNVIHLPVRKTSTGSSRPSGSESVSSPTPSPSIQFTLKGQLASGKNQVQITRTGHRYPNKRFAEWRNQALKQIPPCEQPFVGPVYMVVDYVPGDLIRRDLDGMLSALFHLLEKTGIVLDDAQVKGLRWYTYPMDREHPNCRVTIQKFDLPE